MFAAITIKTTIPKTKHKSIRITIDMGKERNDPDTLTQGC